MSRITLKDLAEMLKISTSTVSRALSDHPDISAQVKFRVNEVAKLMNYYPNDWAKNFRNKRSKLIGLIIPKMTMFFIPSIINGLSEILTKNDYHLLILISDENVETEKKNIEFCCNYGVDGIVISLSNQTQNLSHLENTMKLDIPLVIFDKSISQDIFDEVLIDNESTTKIIADFILQNKVQNLLCIFGSENLDITKQREEGLLTILHQNNIATTKIYAESERRANELTTEILLTNNFDGIFAMSDEVLAGLFSAFTKLNVSPKNYLITAISSGELPTYLSKNISIVKHDGFEVGKTTAHTILDKIKNKESRAETKLINVTFHQSLV